MGGTVRPFSASGSVNGFRFDGKTPEAIVQGMADLHQEPCAVCLIGTEGAYYIGPRMPPYPAHWGALGEGGPTMTGAPNRPKVGDAASNSSGVLYTVLDVLEPTLVKVRGLQGARYARVRWHARRGMWFIETFVHVHEAPPGAWWRRFISPRTTLLLIIWLTLILSAHTLKGTSCG
jgi:hypothetical protein